MTVITNDWHVVPSHPEYEINAFGEVRKGKRVLKPKFHHGYRFIGFSINGQRKYRKVAHFVAEVFLGPRPKHFILHHKDGIRFHDYALNLEYVTRNEHNILHGRIGHGETNHSSKLAETDVCKIISLHKSGMKTSNLADLYKVSQRHIRDIVNRKYWAHLSMEEI